MNNIYTERRKKLQEKMEDKSLMMIFSGKSVRKSGDDFYEFYVNNNFFYLTGIDREAVVYMCEFYKGELKESIYIKKRNADLEKWVGKFLTSEEATEISGIKDVRFFEDFDNDLLKILRNEKYENMYFDIENWNFDECLSESQKYASLIKDRYPCISIRNTYHHISELRRMKDNHEIGKIREAISISKDAIDYMIKNAKPGMKEYELEAFYEFILNTNGTKPSFASIVASGLNGTVLHYVTNGCTVKDGDLVLCDLGVLKDKYPSDISRTFPVNGKFSQRQKEIYELVLKANKLSIELCKPGMIMTEITEYSYKVIAEGLIKMGLIDNEKDVRQYYFHKVTHHLGLDVHDVGDVEKPLEPGCVITIEPGIYIAEEGIGIRIEDDILITDFGYINLSESIPKEISEIEKIMKKAT